MKIHWVKLVTFLLIWAALSSILRYMELPDMYILILAFVFGMSYPDTIFELKKK